MKKAVGYVRVSTSRQAKEGESLSTQRKALQKFSKGNNFDLVEIYADEGISGGSVEKRPGLKDLIVDAQNKQFEFVLVHRLSRLGRNARELLNNVEVLKQAGVSVFFLKENIDLSNSYGQFMLTLLAAMAELEKDISGESSVENKISLAKQGVPSTGKFPFGRRYNEKNREWYLHPPEIKEIIEDVADRYLAGEGLKDISDSIDPFYQLSYTNILKVLRSRCSDTWTVKFKKEKEPITFNVPRLLSDEKIKAVKKRMKFNMTFNRSAIKYQTFLLTGFVWCMECGRALTAQNAKQKLKSKVKYYKYYRHPAGKRMKCRAITSINMEKLNNAVLGAIWENLGDEDSGFLEAWEDNLPDQNKINELSKELEQYQKKLKKAESDREKLVDALLSGILTEEAIKKKNESIAKEISRLKNKITTARQKLSRVATKEDVEEQKEKLKLAFQDHYYSKERFDSMSFEELRALMFSIFDGEDEEGNSLGVYVKRTTPIGEFPVKFEYYINARFFSGHIDSDPIGGTSPQIVEKTSKKLPSSDSSDCKENKRGKPHSTINGAQRVGFENLPINTGETMENKSFKTPTRRYNIIDQ